MEQQGSKHRHTGHKHGQSVFSIDLYAYHSGINHWNPFVKVGLSLALLFICILADNLYVSALVILMTGYVTVVLGQISLPRYVALLSIPLTFLILGSVVIGLNFGQVPGGIWGFSVGFTYVYVTLASLSQVFHLWGKAFGGLSTMYMMSLSTPSHEIFSVLRKVKVPELIIELMNMIYRFVFVLIDTYSRMCNAGESRLGYCDYKTSLQTFGNIASNLFVVSMKKGRNYYDAMESRCYDGELRFLEHEKKVDNKQLYYLVGMIILPLIVWIISCK